MAISYVGSGSGTGGSSSSFTIYKPTGTASGDFMIAIVALDTVTGGGGDRTFSPPSGWVSEGHRYSSPNCVIEIMRRTAGSSEPATWGGTFSGGTAGYVASITATYRGAVGIVADGVSSVGSATSFNTASVSNPTATNWRIVAGAYVSGSTSYAIASNEVRNLRRQSNTYVEAGIWDSNGTIGTGSTSRNVSRGAVWESATSWIGILDATDGAAVTGSLACTLPFLAVAASATLEFVSTMSTSLPAPGVDMSGIASPPSGPMDVVILPVVEVETYVDTEGTLDVVCLLVVEAVAETRSFGIRVVTPEREYRTISPLMYVGGDWRILYGSRCSEGSVSAVMPLAVDVWGDIEFTGSADIAVPLLTADIQAKKVNIVYATDIGDASATSFVVTHNLGSRDVLTAVYEAASPYEEVLPTSIERTSTDTVTVTFPSAPTTSQYRVVVVYG